MRFLAIISFIVNLRNLLIDKQSSNFFLVMVVAFSLGCNKENLSWNLPKENPRDKGVRLFTLPLRYMPNGKIIAKGELYANDPFYANEYGHCWDSYKWPTIEKSRSNLGMGSSNLIFETILDSLNPNVSHYFRTYSVHEYGIIYGSQVLFKVCNRTQINDVINPKTGRIWMDRNLGAERVSLSRDDSISFGDLYQWGRGTDGHQCRKSNIGGPISKEDMPGHSNFISSYYESDWRNPQNNSLWQGEQGINNPCPVGYRLPTDTEWQEEFMSWDSLNSYGAFKSPLKLSFTGYRRSFDGSLPTNSHVFGCYWSSTVYGSNAQVLYFSEDNNVSIVNQKRIFGYAVRCIKD
jgi:uncharacterized protein (TIGR02145 family)